MTRIGFPTRGRLEKSRASVLAVATCPDASPTRDRACVWAAALVAAVLRCNQPACAHQACWLLHASNLALLGDALHRACGVVGK